MMRLVVTKKGDPELANCPEDPKPTEEVAAEERRASNTARCHMRPSPSRERLPRAAALCGKRH